jgi:hypothetical protein
LARQISFARFFRDRFCKSSSEQSEYSSSAPTRIISVHVPKTSGSSLHSQFVAHYGDQVSLDLTHDPFTPAGQLQGVFPPNKTLLHGHFAARRYKVEQAFWLTFLRNPVDNLISIYFYWRSILVPAQELHRKFLSEQPSVVELAKYSGLNLLFSETYFGGFDMGRFNFVGFHENRGSDIPQLGCMLGLPLTSKVHVNASAAATQRQLAEADPKLRRGLSNVLRRDLDLYEKIAVARGLTRLSIP